VPHLALAAEQGSNAASKQIDFEEVDENKHNKMTSKRPKQKAPKAKLGQSKNTLKQKSPNANTVRSKKAKYPKAKINKAPPPM
jgi:hypothetical protein